MNKDHIVEPGKIITIKFSGPSKRPLYISIRKPRTHCIKGTVCISSFTPLAQAIINRRAGEKIEFNSEEGKLGIKIMGVSN